MKKIFQILCIIPILVTMFFQYTMPILAQTDQIAESIAGSISINQKGK